MRNLGRCRHVYAFGMEYLFDANKPHFNVWLTLCDINTMARTLMQPNYLFVPYGKFPAAPPYYAALCGFPDFVEHLIQ